MEDAKSNAPIKHYENSFVNSLVGDPSGSTIARSTPNVFYSLVNPTPVRKPEILIWSESAGALLDLAPPLPKDGWEARVFAGNSILPGMIPYAARYGGHQFGNWAGQLGDGRAISLGEIKNALGQRWEIQLKGAGPTPYSRRADGRAVLRSSLREFLCSEAMFHLGVPTTRALCCVTTGEEVLRDMFYDGHPAWEPGAITTRLSPSFLRFGNFEILAASGETENLRALADYTLLTHFPEIARGSEEAYLGLFHEVSRRTAKLMVEWLRVGFVHGVMNTDNMSILGLTIDYGPYGWLDVYEPGFTPNTTDAAHKRYRYSQQPSIGLWNLARLGEALAPLLGEPERLESGFDIYRQVFATGYQQMMVNKLGLANFRGEEDQELLQSLDEVLRSTEIDMTLFYRILAEEGRLGRAEDSLSPEMQEIFYAPNPEGQQKVLEWLVRYRKRLALDRRPHEGVKRQMNAANPYFIPRNYLVNQALDELLAGDRTLLDELMLGLQSPYDANPVTTKFFVRRPEWARQKPGCSDLSCSS